jgi:hypothetical protein
MDLELQGKEAMVRASSLCSRSEAALDRALRELSGGMGRAGGRAVTDFIGDDS